MTTQPDPVPEGNPEQPLRGPHWAHESIENEIEARREDPTSAPDAGAGAAGGPAGKQRPVDDQDDPPD